MKRSFLTVLVVAVAMTAFPPKVRAMDPITMAILAPVAVKVAEAAKPYVIRAAVGTGRGMLKIGKDAFEILYLPYGLGEMTIGAPFKRFRRGLVHVVRGGVVAPTRLLLHILILPAYMIGAQVNI
ncbi:MAG: hypothetical protein MR051_06850 [Lentisphaeria bacterium]|nr:hypothetical protein [Lentisphaeria bacterium]